MGTTLSSLLAAASGGAGGAILAPLAGLTDAPFRHLCRALGAVLAVTELVSADGVVRGGGRSVRRTLGLAEPYPGEAAVIQVFGADPALVAEAARILAERYRPIAIDLNMGCAAPKVMRRGAGAALLGDPGRAEKMVAAMAVAVRVPVTVKMRAGVDRVVAPEVARRLAGEGAAAITVHGRLASQGFLGMADWRVVEAVREALPSAVHVVGSGDVDSVESFRARAGLGVAVMIGRAAKGNPWIFREVLGGPAPGAAERVAGLLLHARLAEEWKGGGRTALTGLRAHMSGYLRGFAGAKGLRDAAIRARSLAELREVLLNEPSPGNDPTP